VSSAIGFINAANSGLGAAETEPNSDVSVCLFFMQTSQSAQQVLWSMDSASNTLGQQLVYDTTSSTIAFQNKSSTIVLTTIKPILNQWYFLSLQLAFVNLTFRLITMYIKPVGASVCRVFSTTDTWDSEIFTPAFISIGNQHVFVGSTTSTAPFVGSICGVKQWNSFTGPSTYNMMTQEEIERESEQIEPVRTSDLFYNWALSRNTDIRDATARALLLVAPNPGNISQTVGPPIPEYRRKF
jgi:hypothetical protein